MRILGLMPNIRIFFCCQFFYNLKLEKILRGYSQRSIKNSIFAKNEKIRFYMKHFLLSLLILSTMCFQKPDPQTVTVDYLMGKFDPRSHYISPLAQYVIQKPHKSTPEKRGCSFAVTDCGCPVLPKSS